MKYIDLPTFGTPDVLTLTEGEAPTPKAGEVLIEVVAAGINRPDVVQRQGLYPAPLGASPILGLEVSGTIIALGEGVTQWTLGDRVCALANGGGYAEKNVVPAEQCLPIPAGLSMIEAAALPETCFTVWSNVFDRGQLKSGESFLVHGGSSGIGTTAIQMARVMGARVFATAGSEAKCNVCKELGAEIAINYHEEDFLKVLKTATEKRGVNVILDMIGGDYLSKNFALAAMDGRIINIGYMKGFVTEANFMPVMLKRLTVTGSTLRPQKPEVKAAIAKNLLTHIWPKIESGEIKPVIAKTFPLKEVVAAHQLMESNQHIGKIILTLKGEPQ